MPGSGEVTLGGHADRGLTLAALYDTGVLERLRLEVRVRLMADLTQSLGWLHANPRLMTAHRHLLIAPTTVVIGLDGVARVDVRAAKKRTSDQSEIEAQYAAPEVASGSPNADHRADIFSLGVLIWEALAGHRLEAAPADAWTSPERRTKDDPDAFEGVPLALSPFVQREPAQRRTNAAAPRKASYSRIKAPPPLTLPPGGEWAIPIAELALQAMSQEAAQRPADCRSLLAQLDGLDPALLATNQEIAEVVQGISAVATLCVPEPLLPIPDASCNEPDASADGAHRDVCFTATLECARGEVSEVRRVGAPAATLAQGEPPHDVVPAPPSPAVQRDAVTVRRARYSLRAWFAAGLLWLAVIGSLAGYVASLLAAR